MTRLRQIMLEELRRRNYAESTIHAYIHTVEHFSRHFHRSPDQLGPEHIRQYQAALFTRWKLAPNSVTQRLAALRFFYVQVLKRGWSVAETPYPKKVLHLPQGAELGRSRTSNRRGRVSVSSHPADDPLCHGRASGRSGAVEDQRYRQPADGHSYPGRDGRTAMSCSARNCSMPFASTGAG